MPATLLVLDIDGTLRPHGLARAFLFLLSAILILAAGSHPSGREAT